MHLIEINDHVTEDDERLKTLEEKFVEQEASCRIIGGYPVPPVYQKSEAEINAQSSQVNLNRHARGDPGL